MSKKYLVNYLKYLRSKQLDEVAISVESTTEEIVKNHLEKFSYRDHITGLLLGNIQSGKTSQMFGVIGAAADLDFQLFVLLTSDNTRLQEQTFERAYSAFRNDFEVLDEKDDKKFSLNEMQRSVILVLKKNTNVLKNWKANLAHSKYLEGRPLFLIDDEGDAASLNTKVNKNEQSTINRHLSEIRELSSSSIFLQVTATPQAIFLQNVDSNFRPSFVQYFPPGKNYVGGKFYFSDPKSFVIRIAPEDELDNLLKADDVTDILKEAILSFLICGTHLFYHKSKVCNFLIHPHYQTDIHTNIAQKVKKYLDLLKSCLKSDDYGIVQNIEKVWLDLQSTKPDLLASDRVIPLLQDLLNDKRIKVLEMHSKSEDNIDLSEGLNIIVGGNTLSRGVTFPQLQTVYYCRSSKSPNADTYWQHSRIFGYDRDRALVRVFLPKQIHELFVELNKTNEAIIQQATEYDIDKINLLCRYKINPTRSNVIDQRLLNLLSGGVNYFPNRPDANFTSELDKKLSDFQQDSGDWQKIDNEQLIEFLELTSNEDTLHWSKKDFVDALAALNEDSRYENKGVLIVRRDRRISAGTGTLLSPNDRNLGSGFASLPVLTLYRITSGKVLGWKDDDFWIPNIKLPEGTNFYKTK